MKAYEDGEARFIECQKAKEYEGEVSVLFNLAPLCHVHSFEEALEYFNSGHSRHFTGLMWEYDRKLKLFNMFTPIDGPVNRRLDRSR